MDSVREPSYVDILSVRQDSFFDSFVDIETGGEGFLSSIGEDDHSYVCVSRELVEDGRQRRPSRSDESIQLRWPVDLNECYERFRTVDLEIFVLLLNLVQKLFLSFLLV